MSVSVSKGKRPGGNLKHRLVTTVRRDWQLWILLLPALAFFIVFCYSLLDEA